MSQPPDRSEIAKALETEQHRRGGYLTRDDIRRVAVQFAIPSHEVHGVATFFPHFRFEKPARREVQVCVDYSCHVRGSSTLLDQLNVIAGTLGPVEMAVSTTSCLGRCDGAPALCVNDDVYWRLDSTDRDQLLAALRAKAALPAPSRSTRMTGLRADPYPPGTARYGVLRALVAAGAEGEAKALAELKTAGLSGMGGAGFSAAMKWTTVRDAKASEKYVVCNADESEPGTIKDRMILASAPHLLVEGMAIAGVVTGARRGIVYVRHEYAPETEVLREAIADAYTEGVLGPSIASSRYAFELEVFVSPGGYICGEETALLEALEGHRAQPRLKPSIPAIAGLHGKPTVVNNVETLSHVPAILRHGAAWYRDEGKRGAAGFKFVGVSGDVERPGVYEVPLGTTFEELIDQWAGGMSGGRALKALVPSGASSGVLPARLASTPMDWKLKDIVVGRTAEGDEFRSMLGSSAVIVIAEGRCMVDFALNVARFFARESCGKCWPCRIGSEKLAHVLGDVTRGHGGSRLDSLGPLSMTLLQTSICALGKSVPVPIESVREYFADEWTAHVRDGRCPTGVCRMDGAHA
jgi:formate dehydrogenase beta subunit